MEQDDGAEGFDFHFWPKDYYEGLAGWDLDANRMQAEEIQKLGVKVTQMRSDLRAAALKTGQQDPLESSQKALEKLAGKMNRGYFHGYLPRSMLHQALKSDVPPGSRKKGSKRGKVDLAEQMEIAQKVLVGSQF